MTNVYTQAGEEWVVDTIETALSPYIHWGTGAGTHVKGSTGLFSPGSEARVAATESQPAADKNQWVATLTADAAKTITNGGAFTAITGGTLIVAGDFTGIALAQNDKIEFTISLEQS